MFCRALNSEARALRLPTLLLTGIFSRSSYKQLHVRLGDMNDHRPVFEKEEYRIRVPESALVNTPITRLKVREIKEKRKGGMWEKCFHLGKAHSSEELTIYSLVASLGRSEARSQ